MKETGNAKSHVDRQREISEGVVEGERGRVGQESRRQALMVNIKDDGPVKTAQKVVTI